MVLTIDENIVDIARHAQHTVAGAHGEWITSALHLHSHDPGDRALYPGLAKRFAGGRLGDRLSVPRGRRSSRSG
jgi:hypothetical protein